MAGSCRSKLFKVLALAMLVTVLQTPSAQAQTCDNTRTHTCCSTYSQCPLGYFTASQCDASSSSTSVPSPTLPDGDDDSFNSTDSSNDTSTDSSNDASTDATTSDSSVTSDSGETSSSSTTTVYCRRCKDNCNNCSATMCFTCVDPFVLNNGECVSSNSPEPFPVAAVAGGVVGGVVLIVVAIVAIVCLCRRKRQDPAQSPTVDDMSHTPETSTDVESMVSEKEHNSHKSPDYENLGTKFKDMPTQIQRGQDNVLRYTKDPTTQPKQGILPEEHGSTYANQATINLNQMAQAQAQEQQELQQLPTAPGLPTGVQPSMKPKKKKMKKSLKAKDQEAAQPTPEETSEEIYMNAPETSGKRWEQDEEQTYENETSPYVNYGFQNKM